jgi:hypothetical protein
MTTVFEVLITVGFWSFVYDAPSYHGQPYRHFNLYADHALPIILLLIDFWLNRIMIELNQIYPNLIILTLYGLSNLIYVAITRHPIYPPINYSSWFAWIMFFSAMPIFMLFWVLMFLCSRKKFKMMENGGLDHDLMNRSNVLDFTREKGVLTEDDISERGKLNLTENLTESQDTTKLDKEP